MTNIFAGKKSASEKVEEDYIGGGGVLETDIYAGTIKCAYIGKAANSEANSVTIIIDLGGRELRSTVWVSNRSGEVTYKDKKTGDMKNLPGYSLINSLTMMVASKEMGDLDVENLTFNIYDYEQKKEVPQSVPCFSELHGEKVQIAVQRQTVDKTALDQNSGKYEPTGEVRDQNEIIKFFPETALVTISEIAEHIKSLGGSFDDVLNDRDMSKAIASMSDDNGTYAAKWIDRNKGETYDKSTGKGKTEGKSFNKGGSKGDGAAKKSSLFSD